MSKHLRILAKKHALLEYRTTLLAGRNIAYTLKRSSKRRSIGLRIDDNGLTVSVPLKFSEAWLCNVLHKKTQWILEKLDNWQQRQCSILLWKEGERISFRGEQFILHLVSGTQGETPQLRGDLLCVPVGTDADGHHIERTVAIWYKSEAMRVFTECVEHFAPLMNVTPKEIKLTSAKTQWGSCNMHGIVRLNWQLVKMHLHLIDYVVIHELAHLVEMNHSPAFWRLVETICPDYKKCQAELYAYGVLEQ